MDGFPVLNYCDLNIDWLVLDNPANYTGLPSVIWKPNLRRSEAINPRADPQGAIAALAAETVKQDGRYHGDTPVPYCTQMLGHPRISRIDWHEA